MIFCGHFFDHFWSDYIFSGRYDRSKNWLELKIKPSNKVKLVQIPDVHTVVDTHCKWTLKVEQFLLVCSIPKIDEKIVKNDLLISNNKEKEEAKPRKPQKLKKSFHLDLIL